MTLGALLQGVDAPALPEAEGGLEVRGLASDSRRVRPGDLFFALTGLRQDGRAFVEQARASGAMAAVVDRDVPEAGLPLVLVAEPRKALAQAAATFHGHPSRSLAVVGVTGTNGKTTTTFLLESAFRAAAGRPGVLGTIGARLDGVPRPLAYTTPEATELQALLAEMLAAGITHVALELSSHALVQRRCYGLECDVVVFTNLSHDHLDYHGTLAAYLDAKLMLFDGRNQPHPRKRTVAVVNADDPAAPAVSEAARRAGMPLVRFGAADGADVRIARVTAAAGGLDVELVADGAATAFRLPLLGRYNAWNAAGAFAAARALGIGSATAAAGLAAVAGVPGRLEPVAAGQPYDVVVDYAHTPDALERALAAVREHSSGRVLVVFGCGGDRDRAKRPVMGRVARAGADEVWVTSDNPRGEDPLAIAEEILAGSGGAGGPVHVELDRRAAIAAALAAARPGDSVLVAGKGHETTQTRGGQVVPFDDRAVARALLRGEARP
jgi:UDP-N-acetylmuramoyl-L-alanyl-D-glutamate--2,6-diaminopimelate ligase